MLMKLAWAFALAISAAATTDVSSLRVSAPRSVCVLDPSVVKGDVRRLSWSTDNRALHLQTLDRAVVRDFIVTLPDGVVSLAFGEPEWAASYWAAKADLSAPGEPRLRIEVIEDHQRTKPVPFTGGFTAGGAQAVDQRNPVDTFAIEVKLKLLGQEVGYFLNDVAFGGITFGWGPRGSGAIAFVDEKGRVVLFDRDRHKQVIAGTRDALLPAWSPDGSTLAFLLKDARRAYRLMVASIAHSGE
jgi:WD40 repeat protein